MSTTSRHRIALRAVSAALSVLAACAAHAHDLLLIPEPGGLIVRYGHPGDWQPLEPRRLVELQLFDDATGAPSNPAGMLKKQGLDLVLAPAGSGGGRKPLLIGGRYDNGMWARVPQPGSDKPRSINTTRLLLPEAQSVGAYLKFAKALVAAPTDEALYKRPLGHLLELLPQRNPATLKPGEALPVLVLFNGKPLPGVGIEVGDGKAAIAEDRIKRYTTDAGGIAQVTLRDRGIQVLGVDAEQPNNGSLGQAAQGLAGVDKLVMVATYTFVR